MLAVRGCGGGGGGTYVVQGAIFLCSKRGGGKKTLSSLHLLRGGKRSSQQQPSLLRFPPTSDRVQSFVVEKREREKGLRGEGMGGKKGRGGGITTMAPDASSPRHGVACKKCCSGQPAARDRSSVGRRRVFFLGGGQSKSAQYTAAATYEGPCFLAAYP